MIRWRPGIRLWRRVTRHWPTKLATLLIASLLSLYASTDPTTTTQRSLLVPLSVEGVGEDQVVVGVPEVVEVAVSGPGTRVDRLRAEELRAVLELGGLDGEFARTVETAAPRALEVVRVVPSEVIGRIESLRRRDLPVDPVVRNAGAPLERLVSDPERVTVEGRTPLIDRVARVLAPVPGREGEHEAVLIPVDGNGEPVPEVRTVPVRASVRVSLAGTRTRKELAVEVAPPEDVELDAFSPSQETVTAEGPTAVMEGLERVTGTVGNATDSLPPGRYTLPVRLDLPPDVAVFGVPTVELEIAP